MLNNPILLPQSILTASVPPYIGQVATHSFTPNFFAPGNTQMMSRTYHVAQSDLAQVQLKYSNWYGIGEVASGAAATITASIEYPAGAFTQVKFSGAVQGTIPNGLEIISDIATVSIPAGAAFWVRQYYTNSVGIVCAANLNMSTTSTLGEGMNFGASGIADQTMSGTVGGTGNAFLYGPTAIIGLTARPSILVLGDSRCEGQGESTGSPNTTETGQITRSLFPGIAFINTANSGMKASDLVSTNAKRLSNLQYCTHVINALGINDFYLGGASAATVAATMQSIIGLCRGRKVYQTTLPPYTTSTDGFATLANQTVATWNASRVTFNNMVRAGLPNTSGFFETADPVESSRDSGLWKVPGYTGDGLHGSTVANVATTNAGVIVPSTLVR